MHQNGFDFIGLLDLDANSDTVDAGLDEYSLVFVSCNRQRRKESLGRRSRFDFWDVMPLGGL